MLRGWLAWILVALLVTVPASAAAGPPAPAAPADKHDPGGTEDCDVTLKGDAPDPALTEGVCAGVEVHPSETSYTLCFFFENIAICQTRTQPGYAELLP